MLGFVAASHACLRTLKIRREKASMIIDLGPEISCEEWLGYIIELVTVG
jgi:hypothetical protein